MNPPNGTSGGIYESIGVLTMDQWHHLAVTFDGQEVRLYLDGALDSVHNASGVILGNTIEDLIIGGDFPGGDEYFDGTLDDLRLYDGALSASEIADLHGGSAGGPYCFGDGSVTPCPCGNPGAAGEGCANSTGSGATLAAGGSASVFADDLIFDAAGLVPTQPALLFSGLNAVNGGAGVVFGDGLRCAGGSVQRLGVQNSDSAGGATWGPGLAPNGGWVAGDTRRFQAWYRDPVGSPCGFTFNLSHGVEVTFTQ
jgi:hypothetical protein